MIQKSGSEQGPFIAYATALGVGCLLLAYLGIDVDPVLLNANLWPILLFTLLIGLAWRFPFSILPRARMSMDFVFLMASLIVLPEPLPYLVCAGAAILGTLLRRGESPRRRPSLALSAANAGILFASVGAASMAISLLKPYWVFDRLTWQNTLAVGAVLAILNLVSLALLAGAVHQRGGSALEFAKVHLRYISPLEIFTLPLVLALISLYVNSGIVPFLCLAVSLLLVSWVFQRLNRVEEGLRMTNQSLEARTAELAALNSIGREVSSSLEPSMVCSIVNRYCRQVLSAEDFFVAVAEPDTREIISSYVYRGEDAKGNSRLPVGPGFVSWVLRTLRPLLIRDILEEGRSLPFPAILHDPSVRSIQMVPLIVDRRGIGVMGVTHSDPGRYDIDRLSVFTTIGQQAAVAIENARHYQLATVDQLTGLFLRHHFLQRLAEERTRAQRYRSPFAVLMLDLDTFKQINDRHGHEVGDRFLSLSADAIRQGLRKPDISCRWGGDEFCLLLPETAVEGAKLIAERIRKGIEGLSGIFPGIQATASVGIATYPTDFDGNLEDLVRRADQALYRAKREGRNRVAIFSGQTVESETPPEGVTLQPQ